MFNARLAQMVKVYEQLENELIKHRFAVWEELARVEPDLASEVLQLFATRDAAARWASSSGGDQPSPAKRVGEGDAAEVLAMVRRAAHGFSA